MTGDGRPNLDDSRALLSRARKHFAELKEQTSPRNLWQTAESQDSATGEWSCHLHLNRAGLVAAKPIIADCANNLISALDHVVAAIARANGCGRHRNLYFPLGVTDDDFAKSLGSATSRLGEQMANVLTETRAAHRNEIPHIASAKEIANSGKHWELIVAEASALAVAWHVPGSGQQIVQVPPDAFLSEDTFEFYQGAERLPRAPLNIVIQLAIGGLDDTLPKFPDLILEGAVRFVEAVIGAVSEAS